MHYSKIRTEKVTAKVFSTSSEVFIPLPCNLLQGQLPSVAKLRFSTEEKISKLTLFRTCLRLPGEGMLLDQRKVANTTLNSSHFHFRVTI